MIVRATYTCNFCRYGEVLDIVVEYPVEDNIPLHMFHSCETQEPIRGVMELTHYTIPVEGERRMIKIKRHFIPEYTLEEFANKYDLELNIFERPNSTTLPRYFTFFPHVEVMDKGCLTSVYGEGVTEVEAISNYKKEISEKLLAIRANSFGRENVTVRIL